MYLIDILIQIAPLFVYLFMGFFLVYWKALKPDASKHFSNLLFYLTMPALILNSMASSVGIQAVDVFKVLLISFAVHGFLIGTAFVLPQLLKVDKNYIGLYRFMTAFGNVGNVGYPIIAVVMGKEALFLAAVFNIPYNLLVYTIGVYFITMDTEHDGRVQLNKLVTPGLIATALGLISFFGNIQLPPFILGITSELGSMTTPLSLIVIGASLYGVKIAAVLKKKLIFVYSFMKLILVPTVVALVLYALGVDSTVAQVSVIISGMPIAANTVILCQEYDSHVLEASEAVFISTLLIAISIPYLTVMNAFLFGSM